MNIMTDPNTFKTYHVGTLFLQRTIDILNCRGLHYSYTQVTKDVVAFIFQHKASFVLAENGINSVCMGA